MRVTGYEVYRNGEKLVTTGRTEFIDGLLEPNTAYTYQVYAFDESRNYSAASDKINLKTLADTDSPETPHNVKIKSVTGSSLTLSWSASKDNVGTEGYIIYCNNEEIARTEECEFKHSSLNENEEYSYMIKAYDKAGNLSDFSENITGYVVMPKITSITPGDLSSLGGKSQTIVAFSIRSVQMEAIRSDLSSVKAEKMNICLSQKSSSELRIIRRISFAQNARGIQKVWMETMIFV